MFPDPPGSRSTHRPTFTDLAQSLKKGKRITSLSTKYRVESSNQTAGASNSWYNNMPVDGGLAAPTGRSTPTTPPSNPVQTVPRLVTGEIQSSDVNMRSPRLELPPLPDDSDEDDHQQQGQHEDQEQDKQQEFNESDEETSRIDRGHVEERLRRFESRVAAHESLIEHVAVAVDRLNALQPMAQTPQAQPSTAPAAPKRGLPTHRAPNLVQRHRDIREHMANLMKQDSVVDEATAAAYDSSIPGNPNECCTAENFKIALTGLPRRPWNRSAAVIFARSFIALYGIDPRRGEIKNIVKQALVRIKGLFRKSKKERLPVQASKKMAQRNRRAGRKETLFQKRLKICMEHPLLQQHVDFIQRLGRTGMSSDESDHAEVRTNVMTRTRATRFYVLAPSWRNPEVARFLELIDMVGFVTRRRKSEKLGSFFRTRIHASDRMKISRRRNFVPGLPINTYNPFWLDGRNDVDINVYPDHAPYLFTHDPRVLEYIHADPEDTNDGSEDEDEDLY